MRATIDRTTDTGTITGRMTIGMGAAATIDRAITRGIEATATTDIVRLGTDRMDIGRMGIVRTDADTVVIEAMVATGASVSGILVGRTAGPAVDFRFITVIDASYHPKSSFLMGSGGLAG